MPRGVGDVRYSLLCVHWAQCKGVHSRAGSAQRRSHAGPTWTFTCARIQASGRINATRVSSASRRSPASIYIRGRTQVGDSRGTDWPSARPLHSHSDSSPNLSSVSSLTSIRIQLLTESRGVIETKDLELSPRRAATGPRRYLRRARVSSALAGCSRYNVYVGHQSREDRSSACRVPPPSPASNTWRFTRAPILASGPISATSA